jgi:hypothetical protein
LKHHPSGRETIEGAVLITTVVGIEETGELTTPNADKCWNVMKIKLSRSSRPSGPRKTIWVNAVCIFQVGLEYLVCTSCFFQSVGGAIAHRVAV